MKTTTKITGLLFLASSVLTAAVNDVFPTDYVSLPNGMSTATFYNYSGTLHGPYANQKKSTDDSIYMNVQVVRLSHFVDVAGARSAITLVAPYYKAKATGQVLGGLGSVSGNADMRLTYAVWPYFSDGRHIGISATAILPTGKYDSNKKLNIGENRERYIASIGVVNPITSDFVVDMTAEAVKYGSNTDYFGSAKHQKLDQKSSYALTSFIRYKPVKNWEVYTGYQLNKGGGQKINGAPLDNESNVQKKSIGVAWTLIPKTTLSMRYSKELAIDNGFKADKELVLRLLRVF